MMKMLAFTQSNFPIQLFLDVLQRNTTILVLRIYAHFTVVIGPAVAAISQKYFAESSMGKLKIGGSFDLV